MRIRFTISLAALFVAGCGGSEATDTCVSTSDCGPGLLCVDGTCVDRPDGAPPTLCEPSCTCLIDDHCATGFDCVDSRCVDGQCFDRTDDALCAADETCSVESGCVSGTPILDAGASDTDVGDADADAGDADASDSAAPIDTGIAGGSVGDPCTSDADCMSIDGMPALCVTDASRFGREFTGGYCSAICTPRAMSCGPGAGCVDEFGGTYLCLAICEVDRDCRVAEDYGCRRSFGLRTTGRYCRP